MRKTVKRSMWVAASALALVAAPVAAQLPQASASALGLGFNTTAGARGFAAVANNPAGLGHASSPGFSLAVPAVSVETGLGPITLSDLVDYEEQTVPDPVRSAWLQAVTESGGQSGVVGAGVTPFALSIGPIGVQLATLAGGDVTLNPDAVELLMFGNAGVTGSPEDFSLDGSSIDGFAVSTAAVSYGFQAGPSLSLGVTGTYSVGHGLVVGRDGGTMVRSDPASVELDFPMLIPAEDTDFDNGSGVGLDVGAIWEGPSLTVGATIQNLVQTFEWRLDGFSYVPGQAVFDQNESTSDFEEQPAANAPAAFQEEVLDLGFKPVFAVGVELSPSDLLSVRADLRKRVSGGLAVGPDFHLGVGAELRALPILPLQAHLAAVSGGVQVGGGASLAIGPVNLGVAGAVRTGDAENTTLGMVSLSFGGS